MALLAIVFLVLLPVAMALHALDQFRLRSLAERSPCLNCGAALGAAALRLADEELECEAEQWRREHPGCRPRPDPRTLHAVCPACGQGHEFVETTRTFRKVSRTGHHA